MQEQIAEELPSAPEATAEGPRRKRRRRRSRYQQFRSALQERSTPVLTVLLSLAVLASLLAVGTVHVTTLLFVAPLAMLAGVFAIFVEDEAKLSRRLPALIAAILALYSLLQSVPLPHNVLSVLSPKALQIWSDAFRLSGDVSTRWASVSLDPGASRVEALKWFCYAAVYLAGARLAKEQSSRRGALIVFCAALTGGVLSLAHGLFGLDAWFGIYKPQYAHPPWALSPILNPNSFSGYLNLALFAGLGLLFVRKPPGARWLLGLGVAVLAALVVLTASRGGVVALVVGIGLSGLAYRRQQHHAAIRGGFSIPFWLPLVAVVLAAAALVLIGATPAIWQELFVETMEKLQVIDYSRPVIRDHFWTGIGRGAFETVYPAYRVQHAYAIAQFAENFVVQWLVEWGVPLAVVALAGLVWAMRPSRFGFMRNAAPTGIYIAIGVLLLQNLVDLATEIASVGFAVALLLGTLTGGAEYFANKRNEVRARRNNPPEPGNLPSKSIHFERTAKALGWLAAGIALEVMVTTAGRPNALDERWALAQKLQDSVGQAKTSAAAQTLLNDVKTALRRHPADPYIPLIGALLAPQSSKEALSWLNQALRRDPVSARPHLLLAETLEARGATNQALAELKRTAELEPQLGGEVAARIGRWAKTTTDILRAVPDGKPGIGVLNAVAAQLRSTPEQQQIHQELLDLSLGRDPNFAGTNATFAMELLGALDSKAANCANEQAAACETRLRHHAGIVIADPLDKQQGLLMQARLLGHDKKDAEAEQLLAAQCPHVTNPLSCHSERLAYALKVQDPARFQDAANTYISLACSTPGGCAGATAYIGSLDYQRHNYLSALSRFERSAQEQPSSAAWLRVADTALLVGRITRADTALSAALRLCDAETRPSIEARAKELQRERLLRELQLPAQTR